MQTAQYPAPMPWSMFPFHSMTTSIIVKHVYPSVLAKCFLVVIFASCLIGPYSYDYRYSPSPDISLYLFYVTGFVVHCGAPGFLAWPNLGIEVIGREVRSGINLYRGFKNNGRGNVFWSLFATGILFRQGVRLLSYNKKCPLNVPELRALNILPSRPCRTSRKKDHGYGRKSHTQTLAPSSTKINLFLVTT